MTKNASKILLALLFLAILPYNQMALVPSYARQLISIAIYTIRATLIIIVLFYTKQYKIEEPIRKSFKQITLYFVLILILNIISTLINASENINILSSLISRSFSITYIFFVVTYIAYNVRHFNTFCQILKYILALLLFLSIYTYLYIPSIGKHPGGYGTTYLIGILSNRNSVFDIAMPALLLSIYDIGNKGNRLLNGSIICIAVLTILLSKSMTGIISLAFCIVIITTNLIINNKSLIIKIINSLCLIILVTAQVLIISNASFTHIAKIANKSDTLSDRTIIWEKAKIYISRRPLLGYGYDNNIIEDNNIEEYKNASFPNDTHNSMFYVLLASGIIGLIMLVSLIIYSIKCASVLTLKSNNYIYILFFMYTNIFRGITESCWHYSHIIFFAMMIFSIYLYNLDGKNKQNEENK
ncbi:O-antigen ligase family protein [Candidatus Saccharibacteria bacterium]|nr:O-antigen ligase family protein [Candidatus Saccharibacteria bacterium]